MNDSVFFASGSRMDLQSPPGTTEIQRLILRATMFFSQKKTVPTQPLLGCPRKLGSMVSKRVITYLQMGCGFIFFQILIPLSIFTWEEWSKAGGFFAPDFGFVKNPRLPNTFHVRRCHLDPKNLPKRPNLSRYLED